MRAPPRVRIAFTPSVAGLPKLPKKWMLLDQSKLDDKTMFKTAGQSDPGYTELLLENAAGLMIGMRRRLPNT